jgi:hypothetical protein
VINRKLWRVNNLCSSPPKGKAWSRYKSFWPPTIIKALRDRKLIFFMGAGTSAAAKLPAWRDMLELRFGVPAPFLADENLKNDNLTLGEIASRLIGREQLQSNLRSIYGDRTILPTVIHYGLAALELPIYLTTKLSWTRIQKSSQGWSSAFLSMLRNHKQLSTRST